MIMMTDATGCTFIFGELRIVCMAEQQIGEQGNISVAQAVEILNNNRRGEVYQTDDEYIEGVREP